ncbi:hypothetical protein ACFYUR_19245 [Micromonospora haikouensis]|uniref:hypothetical protein n=1 Tax=Micromonospora haikouensis TaxID=686309 RepID=UPI0036822B1B
MTTEPAEQPTYWLTTTRTHDDGYTERFVQPAQHLTAAEAQKFRIRRLRDARTPYQSGPGWVTYREDWLPVDLRCEVRLEWADSNPED